MSSLRNLWRLIEAAREILILSKANIISLSGKSLKKTIPKFSELNRGCKEKMNPQKKFLKFCLASSCINDYHVYKVKQQLCTGNRCKVNLKP